EPNGNRLLRRARAVLALADVFHLLADKLAGRGARLFTFPKILLCPLNCSLLWHPASVPLWTKLGTAEPRYKPPSLATVRALEQAQGGLGYAARMSLPQEIRTERLYLRRPKLGDVGAIFSRYASDPEVTRYLGWPRHRTPRQTEAFLEFSDREWSTKPGG